MAIACPATRSPRRLSSICVVTIAPRLRIVGATVLLSLLSLNFAVATSSASRKQQARAQFEKAEQMREALNARPAGERTRKDYKQVADAYRRVYYLSPASSKADASVAAVAEMLENMGRQFQPGNKDLRAAIGEYKFLRREYPGSKYRFQALFNIGEIYKEDLRDQEAARAAFEEFARRYPRNPLAPQAQQALAELDQPASAKNPEAADLHQAPAAKTPLTEAYAPEKPDAPEVDVPASAAPVRKKSGLALVAGIRYWSTRDYTRVAIDVDAEVKYEAGRVPNPDRIFFDLSETKLSSALVGKSYEVQDGFLKKIRVAQYQPGLTRVVLDVADVSDYSVFLLPNPYRLIIDIHGRQPQSQTATAKAKPPAGAKNEDTKVSLVAREKSYRSVEKANEAAPPTTNPPPATSLSAANADRNTEKTQASGPPSAGTSSKPNVPLHFVVDENEDASDRNTQNKSAATVASKHNDPLFSDPKDGSGPELKATSEPTSAPTAIAVAPRAKDSKRKKSKAAASEPPAHEAEPTSFGDRSLTRTLGLKIGRIVIDAGHGGHDTGTIGPDGLMEKDLVLDVALRLGHLLETRLGADVIYTREDDSFIPLETRTAIANEHQADLFISIHANSSSDPSARGVETYYLNFTSDPDALEVAARENAVSQKSIFELQDLVKKITLKDKIEESRELATDVQQSLYSGLTTRHSALRDRGVKKAPFVVLIGANMPSILAEISFVSNPTDEAKLEKPDYREKIAESLYKGIAKYAGGLSGVKVATKFSKETSQ